MMTKSWSSNAFSRTSERRTSISRLAFRSDCKRRFPMNVFEVVKNVRSGRRMSSGEALRPGRDIAGAKAQSFLRSSSARLKSCPVTKLFANLDETRALVTKPHKRAMWRPEKLNQYDIAFLRLHQAGGQDARS